MKVLGVLCSCRFCRPTKKGYWYENGRTYPITNPEHAYVCDAESVMVDGEIYPIDRLVHTGGRDAIWIYLEEGEFAVLLNKKQVGMEITEWDNAPVEVIARFPASVHGCTKIVKHQELVILKKI